MTDVKGKPAGFVFTGRHMLLTMVGFFGVIISVNMLMAWQASRTWSGLVVPNTYVASQQFNAKVAAQRDIVAAGITSKLSVEEGLVSFTASHPQSGPMDVDSVTVNFMRPVGTEQDFTVELSRTAPGVYSARHEVRPGQWIAAIKAKKGEVLVVNQANRIFVMGE